VRLCQWSRDATRAPIQGPEWQGAASPPPQTQTQTPPDLSLLTAKNGLDNGVHFKTLNVAETVEVDSIGVCFVRYSLGGSVYRESKWLRKINGVWFISGNDFYSFADDPFGDGNPVRAKKLIERVDAWKKDSSPKGW
jgi:hypothetical protein